MEVQVANAFGPQLTALTLTGLSMALVYAIWFRSQRGALGLVWLIWLVLGMGVGQLLGKPQILDIGSVVRSLAPWNLLLLAILPVTSLVRPGGLALVGFWALQLIFSLLIGADARAGLADINILLHAQLPAPIAEYTPPLEPLITVVATLVFFVRWQLSNHPNELALCISSSVFLTSIFVPDYLIYWIIGAAGVLFLSVLYSTHRMAFFDALTGLQNRRSMDAKMGHLGRRYAIAMLDIDHFKRVNDRFGHDFGDQVLKMVATRVQQVGRFRCYRYGGEEFCLVFKGRASVIAEEICEAVRFAVFERPIAIRGQQRPLQKPTKKNRSREKVPSVKVSVSIGLARPSDKYLGAEEVRIAADKALYRAKRNGRNRVERAG